MLTSDPKKRISAYDVLSMLRLCFFFFCSWTIHCLTESKWCYLFIAVQIILGSRKTVKRQTRHWTTLS